MTIAMVHGTIDQLGALLATNCVVAEVHRPLRVDEVFGVDLDTQRELIDHLIERIEPARPRSPAITQLDTGVASAHRLLRESVDGMHSVLPGTTSADEHGHGTSMAGLALYGDLRGVLAGNGLVRLSHRLESVKYVDPSRPGSTTAPELYGAVTADAAARVEIEAPARQRVFSMPVTATNGASGGQPSSWSAALDAISFGTDISSSPTGITLLGEPEAAARRLFVVSAGNAAYALHAPTGLPDYLEFCDGQRVENPGQAWNVLTVGAVTNLTDVPQNGSFHNWEPVAPPGELSPHSRTSVLFDGPWPVKPDIVLEGGNLLTDPVRVEQGSHDVVSLLTTSYQGGLTTANATSAATAQAARLAALVMARYPGLWPETTRGLLVHAAHWTPAMRQRILARGVTKGQRAALLRRYGWGVPTEDRLLTSASSDVTLIIQDEFQPFQREKSGVKMRALRLHELPWPREQLLDLHDATVRMRITLSYFVEPNPSSRGWDVRYRYPSHQLRFDVKRPTETIQEFKARVGREAQQEEENHAPAPSVPDGRWCVGPAHRHKGSLHADIWEGSAAELAEGGAIAVVPVGGWWKDYRRKDRAHLPVRYALLVSLTSEVPTDIYLPITAKIGIPVAIAT
ncbi:S8 family peptidase [Sphaerisporangium sp. NPDC088356]|uniref:S8 family peptidase n=1 Tax=Sphaerisporangium sp. NPDC088356 TaxID=3154871 RepID=UPI003443FBDF